METSAYEPPKFVVKPYPGDTGYPLVKKNYHRFLWMNTWKGFNKKKDKPKINEGHHIVTFDEF